MKNKTPKPIRKAKQQAKVMQDQLNQMYLQIENSAVILEDDFKLMLHEADVEKEFAVKELRKFRNEVFIAREEIEVKLKQINKFKNNAEIKTDEIVKIGLAFTIINAVICVLNMIVS